MFDVKESLDTAESIIADFIHEVFKLFEIGRSEPSGMRVDGRDEGCGRLAEEGVELLKVLVHLRDRVYHFLWLIQINVIYTFICKYYWEKKQIQEEFFKEKSEVKNW